MGMEQELGSMEAQVIYEKLTTGEKDCEEKRMGRTSLPEQAEWKALGYNGDELRSHMAAMEWLREIPDSRPLASLGGKIGRVAIFAKRVIRKLTRFYVRPVCVQQSQFNAEVLEVVRKLAEGQAAIVERLTGLQENADVPHDDVATLREETLLQARVHWQEHAERNQATWTGQIKALEEAMLQTRQDMAEAVAQIRQTIEQETRASDQRFDVLLPDLDKLRDKLDTLEKLNPDLRWEREDSFWDKNSVSQSGEDAIAAYVLMTLGRQPADCTYLDLGANHAKDMSNTYYFYKKGSRIFVANPMTAIIISYREILFYKSVPQIGSLLLTMGSAILLLLLGFLVFGKLKRHFAEEM